MASKAVRDAATRVIEKAIETLEERGHCKRMLEDANGKVCAMGALHVGMSGSALDVRHAEEDTEWYDVMANVRERVRIQIPLYSRIPEWNDHYATTKEDVILTLKKAANDE